MAYGGQCLAGGRREAYGVMPVAGSRRRMLAEIIMSVDIIVFFSTASIWSSEFGSALPHESELGSVEPSRQGVGHRVQLGVYLRAFSGVCVRPY